MGAELIDRPSSIGLLNIGELQLVHGSLLARVAIAPEDSPDRPFQIRRGLQFHLMNGPSKTSFLESITDMGWFYDMDEALRL